MLKPDSSKARQITSDGLMALWRDGPDRREGLLLSVQACGNVKCACRDVAVEGWSAGDQLIGVSFNERAIQFTFDGTPRVQEQRVLEADVNIDTGVVTSHGKQSKSWALEWLRKECDAEMLAALRAQFDAAKRAVSSPPFDWRTADWSWWEPGRDVAWREIHGDDDEASDVVVDGQTYVLGDNYCVEPGCACEEVQVIVWHEDDADGDLSDLGYVTVVPSTLSGAQFHAHGPKRPLVHRIWRAWCDAYPVAALLLKRQSEMRKLAPELQAFMAKRRGVPAPPASKERKVGPNTPCPCGSGKKFKKCCMT